MEMKMKQHKLTTFHVDEKTTCEIHNCKLIQIPCSMYTYCPQCENDKRDRLIIEQSNDT